jgi:hypothetical protein
VIETEAVTPSMRAGLSLTVAADDLVAIVTVEGEIASSPFGGDRIPNEAAPTLVSPSADLAR